MFPTTSYICCLLTAYNIQTSDHDIIRDLHSVRVILSLLMFGRAFHILGPLYNHEFKPYDIILHFACVKGDDYDQVQHSFFHSCPANI